MNDIDDFDALEFDTSEGDEPSEWEKRFENQINTFFDEAIERVPGFVDRHLTSFKRIMGRSVSPKTGLGDVVVGVRNLLSNVSSSLGGPDFSRETYTDEELTRAFEREVVSPEELEGLIRRLFREFERNQWEKLESSDSAEQLQQLLHYRLAQFTDVDPEELEEELDQTGTTRERMETVMEREIAHDPLLAQVIRSGVKIGLPATLGYVLFGKVSYAGGFGSEAASQLYKRRLDLYNRALLRLGQYQVPGWVGAVGWAGGLVGTLAIGGLMEFAVNSIRDVKGSYIRQLNAARYVLLYGENPETPEGQGLIHLVRGLERQFDRLPELSDEILDDLEELDETVENFDGDELEAPDDLFTGFQGSSGPGGGASGGERRGAPPSNAKSAVEKSTFETNSTDDGIPSADQDVEEEVSDEGDSNSSEEAAQETRSADDEGEEAASDEGDPESASSSSESPDETGAATEGDDTDGETASDLAPSSAEDEEGASDDSDADASTDEAAEAEKEASDGSDADASPDENAEDEEENASDDEEDEEATDETDEDETDQEAASEEKAASKD